ncbi:MAG: histidinol-phosphate transaminase [Elusimicrobia bacterium]|nr:histidinol-phosphate transaminase [Elusimicrobiota bacterium]
MSVTTGVRPVIFELESYEPGKPLPELKREIPQLARRTIIKLASNENPLGPSPKALRAARSALKEMHRYPEPTAPVLRDKLARVHRVNPENILVASGADEALRLVVETLLDPCDSAVISQYAFSRFRQHVRLMGAGVTQVPMKDFRHDLPAMALKAMELKAKVIFVANPNNPTGTFNTERELREFFAALRRGSPAGGEPWVVLDEAYHDFARHAFASQYPDTLPGFFEAYPKLIILRTLSKIVGLAGLRVGYLAGPAEFVRLLHRARLIFNVNMIGQAAALAALDDHAHIQRTLKTISQGRRFLTQELGRLGFDVVSPSAANFLFARIPAGNARDLYRRLLEEGVIIRPVGEPGLEAFVRITVGTPAQNKILIRALTKVLSVKATAVLSG